jgi:hypothetical protein
VFRIIASMCTTKQTSLLYHDFDCTLRLLHSSFLCLALQYIESSCKDAVMHACILIVWCNCGG